jgi:trehalose synthase
LEAVGNIALAVVVIALYVGAALVCVAKRKALSAATALFPPIAWIAFISAVRLGDPDSLWARRFYGPEKMARARARFGVAFSDDANAHPSRRSRSTAHVLQEVALGSKSLADYTHLVGRALVDEVHGLAENLQGKRVLHVSATAFGGEVAETLYALVPLMRDVGLECSWQVMMGREEFFNAAKLLQNSLQGDPNTLTQSQWELFDHYNKMNAESLDGEWDVIIVHDPQPVAMRHNATDHARNWVWRCHIDLSEPNPEPIHRLLPLISDYDVTVWHMEQFVPNGLDGHDGIRIVPPAIDPLSPRNMALSPDDASFTCNQFGIDVDRPMISQVSRFDPWKDPIGVIDAYREVTKALPEVQLALVDDEPTGDPEYGDFFQRTLEHASGRRTASPARLCFRR